MAYAPKFKVTELVPRNDAPNQRGACDWLLQCGIENGINRWRWSVRTQRINAGYIWSHCIQRINSRRMWRPYYNGNRFLLKWTVGDTPARVPDDRCEGKLIVQRINIEYIGWYGKVIQQIDSSHTSYIGVKLNIVGRKAGTQQIDWRPAWRPYYNGMGFNIWVKRRGYSGWLQAIYGAHCTTD